MKCKVYENKMGHLVVNFDDGKTLYLQNDYDIAQFAVDCALILPPKDWDGVPSELSEDWFLSDFESITECPDYYYLNSKF